MQQALKAYQAGDFDAALSMLRKETAASRRPDANALALLGNVQFKLGQRREAAKAYAAAAKAAPDKAPAFLKLAVTIFSTVGADAAIAEIGRRAVELNRGDRALAFTVARALFEEGRYEEITPILPILDEADGDHLNLIVNQLRLTGRLAELAALLARLANARPDDVQLRAARYQIARESCDFAAMEEHDRLMLAPDEPLSAALIEAEAGLGRVLWCDDEALMARPSQSSLAAAATLPTARRRRPLAPEGRPLRIGYLSNDFYSHATMTLFHETLLLHDRARFDVRLLSYTRGDGAGAQQAWPERLRSAIRNLEALDDAAAAALVDAEEIDILVDLKGHTLGARPAIVNLAQAPIKVGYLGFPGNVQGVDLDYAVTDAIVTPDACKPLYNGKLCRLPESYQANGFAERARPKPVLRADYGLPEDAFVFGNLNHNYKITPARLALWARILHAVPGSVLWCLCLTPYAADNLRAAFAAKGIGADRLILADRVPYAENLGRARLCDLALDTGPCNGHTTTSDMLWAGLPVLADLGHAFASRVSASLLQAIGLPELIVADDEAYFEKAVALATDRDALEALRLRLEHNRFRAPLFDAERFTRHLETAYMMMAARARLGLAPDHMDVEALPPRAGAFFDGPFMDGADPR